MSANAGQPTTFNNHLDFEQGFGGSDFCLDRFLPFGFAMQNLIQL